ncbi:MAG: MMPL family transporter [Bacteroides sp.]|nr:MMPL family transporter [Bacteroides sp.]
MNYWLIKYRLPIVLLFVGVTVLSLLFLPKLEVDPDLDKYVPDHIGIKKHLKELDSIFGGNEMVLVMLHGEDVINHESLTRLEVLRDEFDKIDGIDRVISPFDAQDISTQDGFIVMDPLLETIPENKAEYEILKSKIGDNTMAQTFFSKDDFSVVSMMLMLDSDASDDLIISQIDSVVQVHPGAEEVLLGGLPFVRYSIGANINKDLAVLLPIAMLLMIIILYVSFKEWKGVLLPFAVVIMSMIFSFGVMAVLGWQISLISVLLPIMLIAIANNYGIHMIARYQELASGEETLTMVQICKQIYTDLRRPIIVTALTTIGGILGLLTHTMVPAAQIGVLASIGIGFALMASIWFLPALLSYFKPLDKTRIAKKKKLPLAEKGLKKISKLVTTYPKKVVVASIVLSIIGAAGLYFIKVDTNIEGYFLGRSKVSKGIELINTKLGGSQYLSVLFSGEVLSPELLVRMDAYEKELRKDPAVGNVSSPNTLLKELSKGFYAEDEEGYDAIPTSVNEVYQSIEVFSMGGNEAAVEQFVDFYYENSRILVRLKDGSNEEGKRLVKKIQDMTQDDPDVRFIAGPSMIKIELADMVVRGQIKSLALAMIIVFILLTIIFKSSGAGFLSVLPLSVAILVLFGLMGFLGITLDIATALISSIMIGVGIDYTIHFLWRFKDERIKGFDHREAAYNTLVTTGKGIIINALSVIVGFSALTLSSFEPLRFFGGLVVISITTCLICALVLIPSIVILVKPRFLEPK